MIRPYLILLRGVNVGGSNLLPMKDLKRELEKAGFKDVATYIQSGNIILRSDQDPHSDIASVIDSHFGIRPKVTALDSEEFQRAVSNNPYPHEKGNTVHFYFCQNDPVPNQTKLDRYCGPSEKFKIVGKVFYLFAKDGIGRSKLVPKIEACLEVSATGRNLNTIRKLETMLTSYGHDSSE